MRLSLTLSRYISRQFAVSILCTLLSLMAIGMLVDVIELIRRASGKDFVPFTAVLKMALLKSPEQAQKFLPFAVLIGSMLALTRLTRTQELIVARAAGVSVWQFLLPALCVTALLGIGAVSIFNPLSAVMLLRFEQIEGKYLTGKPSLLTVSSSGLWLRQKEHGDPEVSEHIIHALRISQQDLSLSSVMVLAFNKQGSFARRLDAEEVRLEGGYLNMEHVTISVPGRPTEYRDSYSMPTTLELTHIQDSFASPETMPFWRLPSFIQSLEKAGFSALRHRLYWHSLLASPLLLMGMVLVAAVFSLRLPRRGRIGMLAAAGAATGFALFFFNDLIQTLGAAGALPVILAAWTPTIIVLVVGTALLLHLEDG